MSCEENAYEMHKLKVSNINFFMGISHINQFYIHKYSEGGLKSGKTVAIKSSIITRSPNSTTNIHKTITFSDVFHG